MGMITVEAEVEIDPVDVIHQVRTDDLREELKNREGGASDLQDPPTKHRSKPMAKELGVGVRVYTHWVPPDTDNSDVGGACKTGVITEGPFLPGNVYAVTGGGGFKPTEPWWNVALDGGGEISARESKLTPIDDDGEAVTDEQEAETHG